MTTRKMRMLAASLAMVLCVSLYSVPRAKAVATEVAVGTAAVASYFQATGLTMAASAGSTGALITTGVADIAGSYAMATGAASSGSAFLSSLAAGVSISPAGAIVLTAAAVVAIGALVAWYMHENGLEQGDTVTVLPGVSDVYSFCGVQLPSFDSLWVDKVSYPYVTIKYLPSNSSRPYIVWFSSNPWSIGDVSTLSSCDWYFYRSDGSVWDSFKSGSSAQQSDSKVVWANYGSFSDPVPGDDVSDRLEILCAPEFVQPDIEFDTESQKQMIIDAGFAAGTSLDMVATEVPNLIATGTLTPTYEITTTEPDTGTDTEPEEDQVYIPMLEKIHTTLTNLGTSIADKIMTGLQSLFVPDEAFFAEAVPELQETFQGRMGLLTFPISLLADFMGRLLNLADQEPILRWNSVSIYGTQLIAAGQYNLKDALRSAPVKQMYDIYMVVVNAILIFAFLGLCHNKYRKIMQN